MHSTPDQPLVDGEGGLRVEDEEAELSDTPIEGWIALVLFWALGLTVLYQFFTRYALNDSAAWTEEIARYLLIGVVFVGAAVGVARNTHIRVELAYRLLSARTGRALAIAADVAGIAFFAATVVLTAQMMQRMGNYKMTIVELPMNIVYGVCLAGFAAMLVRSCLCMREHWKEGLSEAERAGNVNVNEPA
ncbi:MAG TPA: TRAP transporter small permease [Albitalea sp.]